MVLWQEQQIHHELIVKSKKNNNTIRVSEWNKVKCKRQILFIFIRLIAWNTSWNRLSMQSSWSWKLSYAHIYIFNVIFFFLIKRSFVLHMPITSKQKFIKKKLYMIVYAWERIVDFIVVAFSQDFDRKNKILFYFGCNVSLL